MDVVDIPLIGGHPALDFINTWEKPGEIDEVNYLQTYAALVEWSVAAKLTDPAAASALLGLAMRKPEQARLAWKRAMSLRKHLLAVIHRLSQSKGVASAHLEALNELVAAAMDGRDLQPARTGPLAWHWKNELDLDIVWMKLAVEAAALLTDPAHQRRVKTCANGKCGWVFLDATGRRRWCRMNVCGSASKVRRFRDRQKRLARKSRTFSARRST
ncbi:CGNR zinc finger domain-containing protein [Dongia deserti]|uniref:CGNR zinc finger domain-containing protein n=1 Tax=Dongia deserti TaxID=2268030 RepID=UPI0013C4916E|nr:ABATE domain-containing protein [Dongia deserti]